MSTTLFGRPSATRQALHYSGAVYTEQVLAVESPENLSKSPQKPRLLLEFLSRLGLDRHFVRHGDWPPFQQQDFLLAHTPEYVDAFFAGLVGAARSAPSQANRAGAPRKESANASLR